MMPEKYNRTRRLQVSRLRKAGLTYAEIGRQMGLSRERVRQLASTAPNVKRGVSRAYGDVLLTTSEAADLLNVHVNTVRRWSNRGILQTYRIGSRGDRRFRRGDVDKLLRRNHVTHAS